MKIFEETLVTLKAPRRKAINENILIMVPVPNVDPELFEVIDDVLKAAQRTKGGSGPSGLDADGWRKPLTSKVYDDS